MKAKILGVLINLKEQGDALVSRIPSVSNTPQIDSLLQDYELWDNLTADILKKTFVYPQLHNMFVGAPYLGNSNIDQNSFQGKRDRIIYCLPKKLSHLNTAIATARTASEIDLLPLEENMIIANINQLKNIKEMKKIFISHSSDDAMKVNLFVDLIEDIGVPHSQIFYSSLPGFGVTLGEDIFERLKKELSIDVFAVFILSSNFYASPVCLCEMGAVWIKSNKQVPILIPPFGFTDVKGVFPNSLGFKINDKDQLNSFKIEVENYFGLSPKHLSHWENKRDEYLAKINGLI